MELKDVIEQMNREWNEMKPVVKAAGEVSTRFDGLLSETKEKFEKMTTRMDELELALTRPRFSQSSDPLVDPEKVEKQAKHFKAFEAYARTGNRPAELKVMTVGNDTTGGYGASVEVDGELIKGLIEISPVRSIVRVRNTSKRSVRVMKRTGQFAAQWVTGELGTKSETVGLTYGMLEIPTHEIYALVDVSQQDLEDTDFDLLGELRTEFTEQFALAEGTAVISGSGSGRPEGFMTNAAVAQDVTADANNLTYQGFVDVSHNGKMGYLQNARFVFNLKTLGKARLMVNGNGEPLWTPMAVGAPSSILGFPYTIIQGMSDVSANLFPVAFGDFGRAYRLVDRTALEILRDPFTQSTSGAIRFIARKRLGGQVVVAEAIRKLKVAV